MAFLFADRPALLKDLDNDEARVSNTRGCGRWFASSHSSIAHGQGHLITYASTVQGTDTLGFSGLLACYTLSALTLATVFVTEKAPTAMLIGFGAYCILAFS